MFNSMYAAAGANGGNNLVASGLVLLLVSTFSRWLEVRGCACAWGSCWECSCSQWLAFRSWYGLRWIFALSPFTHGPRAQLGFVGQYVFRSIFVSVDIDNTQEAYVWVSQYLSKLSTEGKVKAWGTYTVVNDLVTSTSYRYGYSAERQEPHSAKSKAKILLVPGAGVHILFTGWRVVVIHKSVTQTSTSGIAHEVIWMGTLGSSAYFESFVDEARASSFKEDANNTVVYVQGDQYRAGFWSKALTKSARSWESVILDGKMAEVRGERCGRVKLTQRRTCTRIVCASSTVPSGTAIWVCRTVAVTCSSRRRAAASRPSSPRWRGAWATTFASSPCRTRAWTIVAWRWRSATRRHVR